MYKNEIAGRNAEILRINNYKVCHGKKKEQSRIGNAQKWWWMEDKSTKKILEK